ncbi:MAG: M28 family peptidase [Leptolyngbyaceae cyanobacterium]
MSETIDLDHSSTPSFNDLKMHLQRHLQQLSCERDPYLSGGNHRLTQQYIRSTLEQYGVVEQHTFSVRGRKHTNYVLKLQPQNSAHQNRPPILVGAHYDTVPGSPGADDNASGVAALLEIARYVSEHPSAYPLWCVAFDMEEYGLLGSRAYALALKRIQQPIRLMLSLEMLGYCDSRPNSQQYPVPVLKWLYPSTGDFIGLIGNPAAILDLMRLKRCVKKAGSACEWLPVPQQGKLIPDVRRSDHAPFWDLGYRAIMVTDTSFLRNPHYHKRSDRIETLNLPFMTQVCQGLMTGLTSLP